MKRYCDAAATALLILFAVLAGGAARQETVTIDEVAHIGAGVSYWQQLDLRLNPEHPPLGKLLAATPLVLRGVRADYTSPAWRTGDSLFGAFVAQWVFGNWVLSHWNEGAWPLVWARAAMLVLTVVLGVVIYAYASALGGPAGGLLCLAMFVSTPAFLAFGPLVLTDVPVTLFALIALWRAGALWELPTRRNVLLFGAALAAALLSKFTAGVLLVVLGAFVLQTKLRRVEGEPQDRGERKEWRRMRWRATLRGVLWAALFVYAVYFVLSWNQPNSAAERIPWAPLRRLVMPAWLYLRGFLMMLAMSARPTYLLGKSYAHGVPFYFPVVMALKSPLGFLGLLGLGAAVAIGYRRWVRAPLIPAQLRHHWRMLWVGLVVFTAVCLLSPMDISIRHFSVPMVLMILLMAPVPRMISALPGSRILQGATVGLAASSVVTVLAAYPYYLPYMNSLAMGHPPHELLNDSNVDWNQSLRDVRRFAEERGIRELPIDFVGFRDPALDVPQGRTWDCQQPEATQAGQWVVVSATMIYENHNCGWLMRYPHEGLAGGSMVAVRLPSPIPTAGSVGGPPPPEQRKMLFNAPLDIRRAFLELDREPEKLPAYVEKMMKDFQEQQAKAARK